MRVVWIVVLALAGCATTFQGAPDDHVQCPMHWHAVMKVVVDRQDVSFAGFDLWASDPAYRLPIAYHMHASDTQKWMWHLEPTDGPECVPFATLAAAVDMHVLRDRLTLDGVHAEQPWGGTWSSGGGSTVQIYHDAGDGWSSLSAARLAQRQLVDGERLLIVHGDETVDEIRAYQDAVPHAPGHR